MPIITKSGNTITKTIVPSENSPLNLNAVQSLAQTAYNRIQRELLSANRTYYVRTDGNDSNNGLTNTSGGAFLTIQKAINLINSTIDTAGYDITIQLGDGTYNISSKILTKDIIGGGNIIIQGNVGNRAAVILNGTSSDVFYHGTFGNYYVKYVKYTSTTSGIAIQVDSSYSKLYIDNIEFGACASHHMACQNGGTIIANGPYWISGNCAYHTIVGYKSTINIGTQTVTLSGTLTMTRFLYLYMLSTASYFGTTFTGSYTLTAVRYVLESNSALITNGQSGNTSYFPGSSNGTTATGAISV